MEEKIKILPKLRTKNQLYKDIHTIDSHSPISKNFINQIIVKNNIPYVAVGVKKMYDENIVFDYISKAFETLEDEKYNIF